MKISISTEKPFFEAMMNSYRRNNTGGQRGPLLATTLLVVVVFLIDMISGGGIRAQTRAVAGSVSGVSARAFERIKYSGIFSTRAALAARNQALEAQVAAYQAQASAYKALQEENEELKAMARLAQTDAGITAPVVSSLRSSPYGTFLIGAGTADNVKTGSLVLTEDGFAIGRVADAGAHTALVSALLAPRQTITGVVGKNAATLTGTSGGNARAQIPRGAVVSEGDIVTSAAAGGRPIGIVGRVESEPANAYSTVYIRVPQNISSLRYVFVLGENTR